MKKQDKQGARTPADLERRYALGNEANVMRELNNVKQRMTSLEGILRSELQGIEQLLEDLDERIGNLENK